MRDDSLVAFSHLSLVALGLALLLLILLDLGIDPAAAIQVETRRVGGLFLLDLQALEFGLVLKTARDLLNQPRQVGGALRCDRLDVALEDEEVARLRSKTS